MSYNPNIPATGQTLGGSRPGIQTNFSTLQTTIDQDHVDMNSAGPGKHKQVTFNANNTPGASPSDPSSIIFTKNNAAGHPYPFFLNTEQVVANALPFLPDITGGPNNFGFKMGKLIFNLGSVGCTNVGTAIIFLYAMPSAQYTVVLGQSASGPVGNYAFFNSLTTTGMTVFTNSATPTTVYYLAIGQ